RLLIIDKEYCRHASGECALSKPITPALVPSLEVIVILPSLRMTAMSESFALAERITRTVTGPMWHGPALSEVLQGVTYDQATQRPIPHAHTIWELVLHITMWVDVPHDRLS